jgi:subtilisin-like proprotein convertase family protein
MHPSPSENRSSHGNRRLQKPNDGSYLQSKPLMNTLTRWALCVVTLCFFAMSSLAQLVIPNPNPVNISASDSVVTPYPSEINITGTTGVVERVAVILGGVTHSYPDDLDVLLVSPSNTGNTNILLMSDAGGSFPVNGVNLTFSGFASGSLPNDSQIVSGAFLPSNFADSDADTFASPAPAGPYTGALADLNGKSANGRWKLYVSDDALGDGGSIASWSLSIWTSTILTVTNASNTVNTDEDTPVTVKLKVINSSTPNVTVTATSQNTTALPNANLSISGTGEDRKSHRKKISTAPF